MFIEVKKGPQIFVQHKAMDVNYLAPVTSNFRINLGLIAEVSIYTIKEIKSRKTLDGQVFEVPVNSRVIHLEMSYTHSSHKAARGTENEHVVNERYFYKLVFLPEAVDEFLRIRNILDRQTLS
jgi:competence transcription factor ComK